MVAGVYGFGGAGKTSLCKALCNSYFSEFKGRVCHVEMGSDGGPFSRLAKVLSCFDKHLLCKTSGSNEEQLWNLLREAIRLSIKPVFLAIDNVVAEESIDEAEEYLKCGPFPRGSKIFLTARNRRVLQRVTKHEKFSVLAEMPALEFYEAKNLFFQKMGYCTTGLHEERDSRVNECVRLCTLNKGEDDFHPLMLISLAAYLAEKVELYSDPLMWKGVVAELSSDRCSALKRVFKVLDLIYSDLSQDQKTIFIDLALYIRHLIDGESGLLNSKPSIEIWLDGLYNKHASSYKVETILRELETSSLIQITRDGIYMHDLVKDFAKSKVEKESNSLACLFLEKCEVNDTFGLEENKRCTRIAITKCAFKHGTSTLDLSKLDRLEVLHLVHNQGIDKVILSQEVLQRKLYSLVVRCEPSTLRDSKSPMIISILDETAECKQEESMKRLSLTDLKNCIIEKENRNRSWMMRLLPWSPHQSIACMALRRLVFLRMTNVQGVVFDNLGEFPLLEEFSLDGVAVNRGSIDCPRLKKLRLASLTGVKTISGLEKSPSLRDIQISSCKKLQSLTSIPDAFSVLVMSECPDLERVEVCLPVGEVACETYSTWLFFGCGRLNELVRGECKLNLQQRKPVQFAGIIDLPVLGSVQLYSSNLVLHSSNLPSTPGLASLAKISVSSARHVSHLVSALHVGNHVRHLEEFSIKCCELGRCGCDVDPPAFDLLDGGPERLCYECSLIRDLSSLGQCGSVKRLGLDGCGSVERWPEFANMSSLTNVSLIRCTSLSQWPAIPWRVQVDGIAGCISLPCKELLKPMFSVLPLTMLPYYGTLKAVLQAVRYDIQHKKRDWYSVAQAFMPNSPQLLSILLLQKKCRGTEIHNHLYDYDQKAVLSRLLYDMTASSESDSYSRFGYGYPRAVSCKERRIVRFLKPVLAAREVVTTLLQEFLDVPESQRWTFTKTVERRPGYYVLRGSEYKEQQRNLVLVGLVSIKLLNMSVDEEGLADLMAQIVQSFVSRSEDHSIQFVGEHRSPDLMEEVSLYYYKLLVMRVKDAVCRMARVARVAEKLGESFMMSNFYLYSDLQEERAAHYKISEAFEAFQTL